MSQFVPAAATISSKPPAITLINDQPRTLSIDVAIYFGKQHQHVMRQIRDILSNCPESFNASNLGLVKIKDAKGELRPAYSMTKDGFTLLTMGFTGPKALQFKLAYIEAFNQMEEKLRNPSAPWDILPPDIGHISPAIRLRCLKMALQSAAMSGIQSQAEQHNVFIGLCRLLADPAPPSGPNGPELQAFVRACLESRTGARLQVRAINERLQQWWDVNYPDRPLPTSHEVARLLRKSFERKKGDGGLWVYKGVAFKDSAISENGLAGVCHG